MVMEAFIKSKGIYMVCFWNVELNEMDTLLRGACITVTSKTQKAQKAP